MDDLTLDIYDASPAFKATNSHFALKDEHDNVKILFGQAEPQTPAMERVESISDAVIVNSLIRFITLIAPADDKEVIKNLSFDQIDDMDIDVKLKEVIKTAVLEKIFD